MAAKEFVWLVLFGIPILLYSQANTKRELSTTEAKEHVGESATVCGKVVDAKISRYSTGQSGYPITFFLDGPEATRTFSFATLTRDPAKFGQIKEAYDGKRVCVTGKIMMLGNIPHIDVMQPSQIEMQHDEKNSAVRGH